MYKFENWLTRRFPIPNAKDLDKFKNAFPKAPAELVDFFVRVRGGSFPRFVYREKNVVGQFTYAINSSWPMTDLYRQQSNLVTSRREDQVCTQLFEMGDDDELIPIFRGVGQFNTFYHCKRHFVFDEDGEIGEVDIVSDSLDDYLHLFELGEPDDYELKSEVDRLVAVCDDDAILAMPDSRLREFRSSSFFNEQFNVLHRAIVDDRHRVVKALIDRGFSPFEIDAFENNCFHIAAKYCAIESLKVLTKAFPNRLDIENCHGKTAFELAVERNLDDSARCAIWLAHSKANLKLSGEKLFDFIRSARYQDHSPNLDVSEKIVAFLREGKFADDCE